MRRFKTRAHDEEIMDNLECDGEVVFQTLRELEIINRLLGGNRITINGIEQLSTGKGNQSLLIADLGCGGGDILKLVRRWASKKGKPFQLLGIDANPHIIKFAQAHTATDLAIAYETSNIFSREFETKRFDIVLATLFTHHFTNVKLVQLLKLLRKQSTVGIVINDLHRHWLAYYSIRFLTFCFSRSEMVKFDAPLSVRRSFSRGDWEGILKDAGIVNYSLRWKWAFRWQLVIRCNQN